MSNSKPLPPFAFDLLCYLNRDQLERFSIVCRPLKNLIERYFYSKPYRVFDRLLIHRGSYVLFHNLVYWHPNRDDCSVQKFLTGQRCSSEMIDKTGFWNDIDYCSFAVIHPYLGPTVRVQLITIFVAGDFIYNSKHIDEMESIAYLWRDHKIEILRANDPFSQVGPEDFQPILNSPTILQCRHLSMDNAHFAFKDYKILYTINIIEILYRAEEEVDPSLWTEFLEQPGVKPIVVLQYYQEDIDNAVQCLKKIFSSAVVRNTFKIVFSQVAQPLIEFRVTNKTSGENLELKKGLPVECEGIDPEDYDIDVCYTLERSSI